MATTTLAQGSNPGLNQTMQTFYDRVFLERAKNELRYDFGADVKNVPMNSGKVIYFTRFTPLAVVTTALSEASNPTAVDMTGTTVSATLADYGAYTTVGSLYSMTSIEEGLKEHVEVHGQNAGESINISVDVKPSINNLENLKRNAIISPWQPEASFLKLMQLI